MIVSEIFYGVKCDRCGEMHDDGEHTFWNDEGSSIENAMESEWITEKHKHYCPNCYEFNEDKDDNVPKPDFPLHLKHLLKFINKATTHISEVDEQDDLFQVSAHSYKKDKLETFEENYIKQLLGDNLISFEYKKHERYTRIDCIIQLKK